MEVEGVGAVGDPAVGGRFELLVDRLPVPFGVFEVDRALVEPRFAFAAFEFEGVRGGGALLGEFDPFHASAFLSLARFLLSPRRARLEGQCSHEYRQKKTCGKSGADGQLPLRSQASSFPEFQTDWNPPTKRVPSQ